MNKYINIKRGIKLFLLFLILTLISLYFAAARDEGTYPEKSIIWNLIADVFCIFRFPTHILFWKYMNGWMFFIGLIINSELSYSFWTYNLPWSWPQKTYLKNISAKTYTNKPLPINAVVLKLKSIFQLLTFNKANVVLMINIIHIMHDGDIISCSEK